ncbi:hypothetical protein AWU65_04195 [Paenibacillus glucanolyticus]|uniref:DUF4275 domain-containing protein n=1 Tax=Paenibacillus glucanolyticus TaxID=59843 RepID=A0A163GWP6_9BACL|nr:DUF4275 family protein [Paenibacillus glucanolyticus]KZS45190.1 hypothetical protein AWU65_04195 [Paenibacillus glucanolyticus]
MDSSNYRNEINQMLDSLPEEELRKVFWFVNVTLGKHLYNKNLLDKGVVILELIEEAKEIIDLWDRAFAKNISDEIKKEIHYHQYKWHIFSYKKKECLEGEAARDAFDILTKNELYVMYQNSPDIVFEYKKAKDVVSANFDSEQDIYIFDKSFKWTYVHTHESMCGPYFYKK